MKVLTRHEAEPEAVKPAVPPGFQPLPAWVKARIIGVIGQTLWFGPGAPEGAGFRMTFTHTGRGVVEGAQEGYFLSVTIPDGWSIRSQARRLRPPDSMSGRPNGDPISLANAVPLETASELDSWYSDIDGHCWREGSPWPPQSPPEDTWPPLSPRVVTTIRRHHDIGPRLTDSLGRAVGGSFLVAYSPVDGSFKGSFLDAEVVKRRDEFVCVSASVHPDDLNWSAVHVCPVTGTVRPRPVPLLPGVS